MKKEDTQKHLYGTVLLKAKNILDAIASSQGGMSLSELDKKLKISKPTIFKILQTLSYCRLVKCKGSNDSKKYFLGSAFLDYGRVAKSTFNIVDFARPYLEKLRNVTNETINLGIEEDNYVILLDKIESKQSIKLVSKIGREMHMYSSAMGKTLLSNYPREKLDDYLSKTTMIKMTENTIVTPNDLKIELKKIKEQGFSLDKVENQEEIFCVGFPLIKGSQVYGAFSISAPEYRVNKDILNLFIKNGKETQQKILAELP